VDDKDMIFGSGNPLHSEFHFGASQQGGAFMATTGGAYALAGGRNPLWENFRRCVAFDDMYYGNPPLELDNGALRDVYTVLQLPSPDNTTLNKLRHIGKKFLGASFKPGVPSETLHEDVNDFFWSAIADEMVERAIDALARTHVCVSHPCACLLLTTSPVLLLPFAF
jgi:hypothetical protein